MSFRDKSGTAVRDLIEQAGRQGSVEVIRESLQSGKLKPEDFSLREIWDCVKFAKIDNGLAKRHGYTYASERMESVTTDFFPTITGELINAKVIGAYDAVPKVGELMIDVVPSNVEEDKIVWFSAGDEPDQILEGDEYNETDMTEKYYKGLTAEKIGRIISITQEMIY